MDYYPYVVIAQHFLCFIFVNFSLYFSIKVLFNQKILKKSTQVSPTIIVYFIYVFIFGCASNINHAYLFAWFRPDTVIYDARILFFGGFIPGIFMTTNSVIEFFLCIDRCISIIFPMKYTRQDRTIFSVITFIGMFIASGGVIYLNRYIDFIPDTSVTTCRMFGCMLFGSKYTNVVKITLISANIFAGIILAFMIQNVFKANSLSSKRINKTVLITIITSTFVELPPFIVTQVFLAITGTSLSAYAGPYGSTVACLNIFVATTIYYRAFKNVFNSNPQVCIEQKNQQKQQRNLLKKQQNLHQRSKKTCEEKLSDIEEEGEDLDFCMDIQMTKTAKIGIHINIATRTRRLEIEKEIEESF